MLQVAALLQSVQLRINCQVFYKYFHVWFAFASLILRSITLQYLFALQETPVSQAWGVSGVTASFLSSPTFRPRSKPHQDLHSLHLHHSSQVKTYRPWHKIPPSMITMSQLKMWEAPRQILSMRIIHHYR